MQTSILCRHLALQRHGGPYTRRMALAGQLHHCYLRCHQATAPTTSRATWLDHLYLNEASADSCCDTAHHLLAAKRTLFGLDPVFGPQRVPLAAAAFLFPAPLPPVIVSSSSSISCQYSCLFNISACSFRNSYKCITCPLKAALCVTL